MLNGTLKILGIVVLLLITLFLLGFMEVKEYRSVDEEMLETLRKPSAQSGLSSGVRAMALDSKIFISTHYRIDIR